MTLTVYAQYDAICKNKIIQNLPKYGQKQSIC